ncbi:MAG: hypothetical protein OJF50_001071 [Nitrospira sp.]|nr:hypothetical protein [Nitrospira sp.]
MNSVQHPIEAAVRRNVRLPDFPDHRSVGCRLRFNSRRL